MSTARRDTPDEWGGLVSHWMNEKEKAFDYFDPKNALKQWKTCFGQH